LTTLTTSIAHSHVDSGVSYAAALLKRILNLLGELNNAAIDRSRLAALPRRFLDDVGMTAGERAAILGYEEQPLDPFALAVTQRL
jgi:hypothetical protein